MQIHVEFMVVKVALGIFSSQYLDFLTSSIMPQVSHIHIQSSIIGDIQE
jgi:hypothetical protein